MESRYEQGMRVRTEVLGADHVARTQEQTTPFDADFQRFITETAWGASGRARTWSAASAAW